MEFFGMTIFGSLSGGALMAVAAVLFVVGLIAIIKGGDWFVDSAAWFAEATGIPKFVVGATVVSFATTLPELLVSVRAAMNGSAQLAIGNAVGSVTANTTLIMGVSLVAMAGVIKRKSFSLKAGLLLGAAVALTALSMGGAVLITADHGNADRMIGDDGNPFTPHSTNPVPFCVVGYDCELKETGRLADIAPTMLTILGLPQPAEMTGETMIK